MCYGHWTLSARECLLEKCSLQIISISVSGVRAADGTSIDKYTQQDEWIFRRSSVSEKREREKKEMKTFPCKRTIFHLENWFSFSLARYHISTRGDHLSQINRAIVCFQLNLRIAGVDAEERTKKKRKSFYGNFIHSIGFPFYRLIFQLTSYYHCRRCRMHISLLEIKFSIIKQCNLLLLLLRNVAFLNFQFIEFTTTIHPPTAMKVLL